MQRSKPDWCIVGNGTDVFGICAINLLAIIADWICMTDYSPYADVIGPSNKPPNVLITYPTMNHFVTEMCRHVRISAT